jgi:hypothetical protein
MGLYHVYAQKTLPLSGPITKMYVFAAFTQNQSALTSFGQNPKYVSICPVGVALFYVDKWPDGQVT